jgi:hypothetical protein
MAAVISVCLPSNLVDAAPAQQQLLMLAGATDTGVHQHDPQLDSPSA